MNKKNSHIPKNKVIRNFLTHSIIATILLFAPKTIDASKIAAGSFYSTVIQSGTPDALWSFGFNQYGQLGNGSNTRSLAPDQIDNNTSFTHICSGASHVLAINSSGELHAWGRNSAGQLGLTNTVNQNTPTRVGTDTGWTAASAGFQHSVAIRNDQIFTWGANSSNQLGLNSNTVFISSPTLVTGGPTGVVWVKVTAGTFHSMAIDANGALWAWGNNDSGQLGLGTSTSSAAIPTQVGTDSDWAEVVAGEFHTIALKQDGSVYGWGRNFEGQLGIGASQLNFFTQQLINVQNTVGNSVSIKSISAGKNHTLAIDVNNNLWAWGANLNGQLGSGGNSVQRFPLLIDSSGNWDEIVGGEDHSLASKSTGAVFSTGNNTSGQLGSGSTTSRNTFAEISFNAVSGPTNTDFSFTTVNISATNPKPLQSIDVSFTVLNSGATYTPVSGVPAKVQLVLSTNSVFGDAGDVTVATFNLTSVINSNQSFIFTSSTKLPTGIDVGNYFFGFKVDSDEIYTEVNESNNISFTDSSFTFLPDLTVPLVTISDNDLIAGENITLNMRFSNTGSNLVLSTGESINYRILLSTDSLVDGSDILVANDTFSSNINFNSTVFITKAFSLPASIPAAAYKVLVVVNPDSTITELSDGSNIGVATSEIELLTDLVIQNLDINADQFIPGNAVNAKMNIVNQGGDFVAGNSVVTIRVVYSIDQTIDQNDVTIGTFTFNNNISFGSQVLVGADLTLPDIDSGTYFLGAIVDSLNVVTEKSDSNNSAFLASTVELLGDLIVTGIDLGGPITVNRNDNLTVNSLTVQNSGNYAYPSGTVVNLNMLLTLNSILGDTDDLPFDVNITFNDGIAKGEIKTVTVPSPLIKSDTPPGNYFGAVLIDPANSIKEVNDSNNTKFTTNNDITVNAPNIQTALQDHIVLANRRSLDITLTGNGSWFAQDSTTEPTQLAGTFAAQSGAINDGETSSMEFDVTITNPATVSFFWTVSSEFVVDKLNFTVNGSSINGLINSGTVKEEIRFISGIDKSNGGEDPLPWQKVTFELDPGVHRLKWIYSKDASIKSGLDAGFVDGLTITEATGSDFTLTDILFDTGTFTVGLNSITITATGSNLGDAFPGGLPDAFRVEARLSQTQNFDDGILLGNLEMLPSISDNSIFVYQKSFSITSAFASGNYFVVLKIFADTVAVAGNDDVPEVSKTNNIKASTTASVEIQRLPDLFVQSVTADEGLFFKSNADLIDVNIVVKNIGEADIPVGQQARVKVILTADTTSGNSDDIILTEFNDSSGLASNATQTYEVAAEIPSSAVIGVSYFIGVTVDEQEQIVEKNESTASNQKLTALNKIVFSEIQIGQAIDLPNQQFTFSSDAAPWFGQTTIFFPGETGNTGAVQSSRINDSQKSSFQTAPFSTQEDTVAIFYWKVSSEQNDKLKFYIDGILQGEISGEVDWTLASFPLQAGNDHILRWDYEKDEAISAGSDAAWVDVLAFEVPDLTPQNLNVTVGVTPFFPSDSIPISFEVKNLGIGNSPTEGFNYQVWLSLDPNLDTGSDLKLLDQVFNASTLALNQSVTVDLTAPANSPKAPSEIGQAASYFMIIVLDSSDVVPEANNNNNVLVSSLKNITLQPLLSLEQALDTNLITDPVVTFDTGGGGNWFSQQTTTSDGVDAVQSPVLTAGEESFIETTVPGPRVLSFDWLIQSDSPNNTLRVFVDGTQKFQINGNSGAFETKEIFLSAASNVVKWTYSKVTQTTNADTAYVDKISFRDVTKPDFIFGSVNFPSGDFIVNKDQIDITLIGRNQGVGVSPLDPNFKISVYLSSNNSFESNLDTLLGDIGTFQDIGSDGRFTYRTTLPLNQNLVPGNYFLILILDSANNLQGVVDEEDETNNVFVSSANSINVIKLPDLRVVNEGQDVLTYLPGKYITDQNFQLSFNVINEGLADVVDPFKIKVLLTPNRALTGSESLLIEFEESEGLPIGQKRFYQVTVEIPGSTEIGSFLSLVVDLDTSTNISEANETNNSLISENEDIFVQNVKIEDAVDVVEGVEFITSTNQPWFGQFSDSFDGEDAVQTKNLGDNETSFFSITRTFQSNSRVSFYWRTSSERVFVTGDGFKEDFLVFTIDGVEQGRISGINEWDLVSFPVTAGSHVLRWEYIKNDLGKAGDDAAFVDKISFIVPDLSLDSITNVANPNNAPNPTQFVTDDTINYTINISNPGIDPVPTTPAYTVEVRISRNQTWGDDDDHVIDRFTDNNGLAAGISTNFSRSVKIPKNVAIAGNYYIAATVDVDKALEEGDETNNEFFSVSAQLSITPAISLDQALEFPVTAAEQLLLWNTGGNGTWFGQNVVFFDDSGTGGTNNDAAQASEIGFNEEVWMEREIDGPALLTFSWKVDSLINFNFLRLIVNNIENKRISGNVDWQQEQIFIPAGRQKIRWAYTKFSSSTAGSDTGWVDKIVKTPVTVPDLAITTFETTAGSYTLDIPEIVEPDRDKLPITVVVTNLGTALSTGGTNLDWAASDIEARLSIDKVFGNEDDIILGQFARVETFDQGERLVFTGPITLGISIPANSYYLGVRVDAFNKVNEFDENNNVRFTDTRNITIVRLPNIFARSVSNRIDNTKIYHPEAALDFQFDIINNGLSNIEGNVVFNTEIQLQAIKEVDYQTLLEGDGIVTADEVDELINFSTEIIKFGNFSHQAFLRGRVDAAPSGDFLKFNSVLTIPTRELIKSKLLGADDLLTDYVYYLAVLVDSGNAITESDERNLRLFASRRFSIEEIPTAQNYDAWVTRYTAHKTTNAGLFLDKVNFNDTTTAADDDNDGISNFEEYAFNLNPLVANAVGNDIHRAFDFITVDGSEYLSLTFDVLKSATDLTYTVQESTQILNPVDSSPWTLVKSLVLNDGGQPKFIDVDKLNAEITGAVLSASDQGYTIRFTIRSNTLTNQGQLFMRLIVE